MTVPAIKVLLVEDNPADVLLLRAALEADPLDTFSLAAIERLNQVQALLELEQFDIVLLDLGLPDSQGINTFEQCQRYAPGLPIIVFSGNTDEQAAIQAVRAGAQDYLVKDKSAWEMAPRAIRYAIERQKLGKSLQESEERHRQISTLISDYVYSGLVSPDATSKTEWVSGAFERITGYTIDEINQLPAGYSSLVLPDDLKMIMGQWQTFLEKRSQTLEYRIRKKNGETCWLRDYMQLVLGQQLGNSIRIIGAVQDITERKQAEEELERFFNLVPDMVCIATSDGYFKKLNSEWERNLGYSRDELLAKPLADFIHPDDRAATFEEIERQIKGDATLRFINRYHSKDGTYRWLEWNATPSPDETLLFAAARDVTERKQAEEKLQQSEKRLREAQSVGRIGDWELDLTKGELYYSDEMFVLLERDPALGAPQINESMTYLLPEDAIILQQSIQRAIETGAGWAHDSRVPFPDGRVAWHRGIGVTIKDEQGNVIKIHGVAQDITERKQVEDALQRQNEMLIALHNVTLQMGAELDLAVLLETLLQQAQSMLHGDRGGGIYLYDPGNNVLRLAHGSGINQGRDGVVIEQGTGVVGQVYQTRQPLVIDDYTHWEKHAVIQVPDPPSTVMGVPLFLNGEVIGVLTLIANSRVRKFIEQDVQQAKMFAAQAAVAIQNAQLYQQARLEIAERKQAEEAQRQSEADLAEAQKVAKIGNWRFALSSNTLKWSEELYRIFDVEAPEFGGMYESFLSIVHADDKPLVMETNRKARESGEPFEVEYRIVTRTGQLKYIRETGYAVRGVSGEVNGLFGISQDITEHKQAEQKIQELQEFTRATIDALSAHICVLDENGVIVSVNRAWHEFSDANPPVPEDHFLGANYLAVCDNARGSDSTQAAAVAQGIRAVMSGDMDRFQIEYPCHSPQEERWFIVKVTRFVGSDPARIVIAHESITERKQAEESLRRSEEQYRYLFENNPHPMWAYDLETLAYLAVNDAAVDKYGYTREEFLKMTIADIRPAEDVQRLLENVAQSRPELQHSGEWRHKFKDGTLIDVEISSHTMDLAGRKAALAVALDVTERKRAEDKLRESERKYRTLHDSMIDGFVSVAMDGKFLECNAIYREMLGYSESELAGLTYFDITPEAWRAYETEIVENQILKRGYSDIYEKEYRRKDGSVFPVELHTVLMRDEDGQPTSMWAIVRDITERKQAEEQLRRRVNELEVLYENGLAISSLMDTHQIAEKVIEIFGRKLKWHHAIVRLYDPAEKKIDILAFNHSGLSEREYAAHFENLRRKTGEPGKGISGWVLKHGETVVSNDVRQDERYIAAYPGIRSGLYVPLKIGAVTIGSISVESNKTSAFRDDDRRLLETIASQASIAIENAQLYLKVQQELIERQQAQESLRQSERHLRAILQTTSDGFWIVDRNGGFLDVNDAYCQMSGYSREEFSQLHIPDIEAAETGAETAEHIRQIMEEGSARFETRHRRKDGSVFDVEIGVNRLDDELICFCHDITSRKLAEQEIRQVNERFTQIANNISDIFWIADPLTGKHVYVSPAFEPIIGLSYESVQELSGGFADLVLEEDRHILLKSHEQENLGFKTDIHYRIRRPDGSIRWLRDKSSPVLDKNGKVAHVVGVARDLTEQVEAEKRLRESEARFRLIAETIDEVFWMADPEINTMLYVSPGYERVWGRTLESLYQTPTSYFDAILTDERERVFNTLALQKTGAPFSHEYHILRSDGSIRTIWDRGYPVADEHGTVTRYIGVAQDITARKQAEEERQELIEALSARTADLSLLLEAGHALSETLDRQQIYAIIYRYTKAALPCDMLVVSSFDPKTELISCEYLQTEEGSQDVSGFPLIPIEPPGQGTQSRVISSGESLLLPDYVKALKTAKTTYYFDDYAQIVEEPPEDEEQTRSAIIVPLKVDGKVGGALQIFSAHLNAHTEDHLRFVEALAFHISAALSNASLFSELEQRVKERTAEIETIRQRLELATKSAKLGVWDWNIKTGELLWDEQMSLNYGIDKLAFRGTLESSMSTVHPEDVATLMGFAQNVAKGLKQDQVYYRVIRGEGSTGYIKTHGVVLRDETGLPQRVIGVTQDITQEKLAELALRESEEQNRLLFEESPDAITLLDTAGKIIRANRAYEQLVQIPMEKLLSKTDAELGLITPETREELLRVFQQSLERQGNFTTSEYVLSCGDGSTRNVESRIFWLIFGGVDHILVTSRDVTFRKKAEETLRLANAELERALRLKDEFLANMSHELRTPLNAILGISESMEEQVVGPLNDKQQHYLRTISESGRHLLALINDILDLSKIEAGRMDLNVREVTIETLVQSSLRMVKELAQKKNLNVSFTLDNQVQSVVADERRLKQVLVNLLSNAVKFTPENGQIGLDVTGDRQAEQITFTIWDNGIGIGLEDLPRLFRPFVQLDSGLNREHAGTGLGLALVSEIIRLHGGRVGVKSLPGEGSRFFVVLPWKQEEKESVVRKASADVPTQPLIPNIQANRGKILLVEDTEAVILFVNDYLRALGYQVIIARDGLSGVSEAKNQHPDLILMDIQMPGIDGFDATRAIRRDPALKEIPIIALTAMAMPGDRERCLEAGMQDYLSKPIFLKELTKMVHDYLPKGRRKSK